MIGKNQTIIAFTKDKLIGAVVSVRSKKIKKSFELGWTMETLDVSLLNLLKKLKSEKVRILISRDLSYVLRLEIPKTLSKDEVRSYIKGKISETIPEHLGDKDWDYKEVELGEMKDESGTKEVLVISIVKDFYNRLSKAVKKLDIDVEAVEPEEIAVTRNKNPMIGLAVKRDLRGKDEEVLNLELFGESEGKDPRKEKNEKRKAIESSSFFTRLSKIAAVIFLIIFTIGALFYGYWVIYKGNKIPFKFSVDYLEEEVLEESSQETDEVEDEVNEVSPTPEEEVVDEDVVLSDYTVEVQNGTGIPGEAENVQQILLGLGFTNVSSANADNFNYSETSIQIKEDVPESIFLQISESLSDYEVVRIEEAIGEDFEYDILVIVGERSI